MPIRQCLGRLVKDTRGVGLLSFDDGTVFHIPYRCESMARDGDLCTTCIEREKRTIEKVREITGTTIKGMLPSYLNGRVIEPIPFWSRLYDGAWFRLKIESGCTISEEIMAKARKAAAVAYEDVKPVEPQPMPGGRKIKKKRAVPDVVPVPAPIPIPIAVPVPRQITIKPKKHVAKLVGPSPVAILREKELPVETIQEIHVRPIEIDGRALYISSPEEKLYDLKFKYIGYLNSVLDVTDV